LVVLLAVIGLISTVTLNTGGAAAAQKALHPAIPAVGEGLSYYAQGGSGDLLPNSQSVIKNPKAYLIFEDVNSFWEQTFSDPDPRVNYGKTLTNMQVVEQYFTDVSGSAFERLLGQYSGISNTITLSKAVVLSMAPSFHSDLCGTNTISDSGTDGTGIADIWNAVAAQAPIDSSTIYFVFTPKGFNVYAPWQSCTDQPTCGYHHDFLLGEGIYAVIPYGGGSCGAIGVTDSNGVQIDINTASHEQFEAITDPGTGQVGTSDGWHDSSGFGGEIGDKCQNEHLGAYLNGHNYPDVQGEYDNSSTAVDPTTGQPAKCAYAVTTAYPVVDVPGGGAFYTVWQQVGGANGPLMNPTSAWFSVTGGQQQDFQGGSIYWSSTTGTYEVQGAIYNLYTSTVWKGPSGPFGFPTSNEQGIASGRVSYFYGALCGTGSRGPDNSGSAIYYSAATGAHFVWGCIYNEYWNINGPVGLGLPVTDELAVAGGHVSYFAGQVCNGGYVVNGQTSGSGIFDTPSTKAHEVHGCIYHEYEQIGGPGYLGFPLQDEQGVAGGHVSYFAGQGCSGTGGPYGSGSAIFDTPSTSAHEVQGCIYGDYELVGGPGSLGFPLTDEQGVAGGRVSYFAGGGGPCGGSGPSGSGSAVYYTFSTHAHAVQGCVYATYLRLGGPSGRLGFPVSDQNTLTDSSGTRIGWASYFQGTGCGSQTGPYGSTGAIYVPASNNTASAGHEVQGCIFLTYAQSWGGAAGPLGFPTTDEYTNNSGDPESDFQNGSIVWHNGQALVTLNNPGCGAQSAC
jgi:uncharacterized protein with LGFP repeats